MNLRVNLFRRKPSRRSLGTSNRHTGAVFTFPTIALPGGISIFQARCQGIGYWTHFLLGAGVGVCFVVWRGGWLWRLGACLLIAYQVLDYFIGSDSYFTAELALARDLSEYALGFSFVVAGSLAERATTTTTTTTTTKKK